MTGKFNIRQVELLPSQIEQIKECSEGDSGYLIVEIKIKDGRLLNRVVMEKRYLLLHKTEQFPLEDVIIQKCV